MGFAIDVWKHILQAAALLSAAIVRRLTISHFVHPTRLVVPNLKVGTLRHLTWVMSKHQKGCRHLELVWHLGHHRGLFMDLPNLWDLTMDHNRVSSMVGTHKEAWSRIQVELDLQHSPNLDHKIASTMSQGLSKETVVLVKVKVFLL